MVKGNLFNKGVKTLDVPHVGHVVRDTKEKIVIFGEGDDRFDIPKSDIRFTSGNVLLDMPFHVLVRKYKVSREAPLPTGRVVRRWEGPDVEPDVYEKKHPEGLYNKSVWSNDRTHVGFIMKESADKIVILGHYDWRFDVPKSAMMTVGENVVLKLSYEEVFKYKVDRNAPLPTGEPYDVVIGGGEDSEVEKQETTASTSKETAAT